VSPFLSIRKEGNWLLEQSSGLIQDPQEQWATHELQQLVREAVGMLSAPHREVAYLFYYEEMSMQQIAHLLHLSLPAVKNRLYRGRQQLRHHLKALSPERFQSTTTKRRRETLLRAFFVSVLHPKYVRADLGFLLHTQHQRTSSLPQKRQEPTATRDSLPACIQQDQRWEQSASLQQHHASRHMNTPSEKIGGTMQNDREKRFRISAVWAGIIITGLPLALGLAQFMSSGLLKLISFGVSILPGESRKKS
jgi:predicted DNA-binding protein YlxM (UPF0122 family)